MGDVLEGRDVELGRDVAVKVFRATPDQVELGQRFLEEPASPAGCSTPALCRLLPGLAAGRPALFHHEARQGPHPGRVDGRRKELGQDRPRFLAVFEQVCQTLAYGDSKVIHRDLKPSNVIATSASSSDGWGLAKVLPRDGATAGNRRTRRRRTFL